jgi:hypothetical protein
MSNGGIPLGQWNGSDATRDLHNAIIQIHDINAKESQKMLRLTWAILILTFIILVLTLIMTWPIIVEIMKKILG